MVDFDPETIRSSVSIVPKDEDADWSNKNELATMWLQSLMGDTQIIFDKCAKHSNAYFQVTYICGLFPNKHRIINSSITKTKKNLQEAHEKYVFYYRFHHDLYRELLDTAEILACVMEMFIPFISGSNINTISEFMVSQFIEKTHTDKMFPEIETDLSYNMNVCLSQYEELCALWGKDKQILAGIQKRDHDVASDTCGNIICIVEQCVTQLDMMIASIKINQQLIIQPQSQSCIGRVNMRTAMGYLISMCINQQETIIKMFKADWLQKIEI